MKSADNVRESKERVVKVSEKYDDKNWSIDDVDRLLSRTEKPSKKEETVVENFARTMRLADTTVVNEFSAEKTARIETVEETVFLPAEPKTDEKHILNSSTGDIQISSKTAKQRVSDIVKGLKTGKSKKQKNERTNRVNLDEIVIPKKEPSYSDEYFQKSMDSLEIKGEDDIDSSTKVVDTPAFMYGSVPEDTTRDFTVNPQDDYQEADDLPELNEQEEIDLWAENQIRFSGFDGNESAPEKISEDEAEQNLQIKRREKIDKFKLMGIAEAEEESHTTNGKLEKLFGEGSNDDGTDTAVSKTNSVGIEYTDPKDANRIRVSLHKVKRMSFIRFAIFSLCCVAMLVTNIVSSATVGFDATISHIINVVLLIGCMLVGMNSINSGVIALLKREPNLKSAISLVSAMAFIQTVTSFVTQEILDTESFVVSACAAFAFAVDELGDYLRHSRTFDAFNFCTGREKERLYSVQRIENRDDEFEIGRVLLMNKPDIRYSCKTNFPAKLIGKCESEVSSDKLTSLLLPISFIGGILCAVIAGIFSRSVSGAVTGLCAAVCLSIPAFGTAAVQFPLRWANKRLNKAGGMISGQKAIDDFSKANAIVVDSSELFDQQACRLHGIKDFKRVRIDDLTLYAAAMIVRSGGPLTAVFDQVVSKRDLLPTVKSFNYEDRLGVSGWINSQKVIMGNRAMMRNHNIDVPDVSEEEKYTYDGRRVVYLAIANQLAAMLVVSYAPDKRLIPFIKRLGTDGVTLLLRNYDSNVTTDMINEIFGVRFTNIRLINNTSGRIYKKYKKRVRETSKSGIIHDGTAFSLFRSFTMSYALCGTFKVENLIQLINVIAGFTVVAIFSIFDVISITGVWPLLIVQAGMAMVSFIVARVRGIF